MVIYNRAYGVAAAAVALLALGGCLNSASSSSAGETSASGVTGISPWTVHLTWDKASSVFSYKIYSLENESKALVDTPFLESNLSVSPASAMELRVYKFDKNGASLSSKPHRSYSLTSWAPFESSGGWTGQTQEYAGIQISWSHIPWEGAPLAPAAGVEDNTFMRCYFLPNGTLSSDPFGAGAITVQAPIKSKVLKAGTAVAPLTRYAVGCEVVYADGKTSRHSQVREITSSTELAEDAENAFIETQPSSAILVSRALSLFANNAVNGTLNLKANWVDQSNVVQDQVLTINKSSLGQHELISFDSPFPTIPNRVYGGKFRLQGTFTPNSTGVPKPIGARDFYVKTADDIREATQAALDAVLGAQRMGAATAVGDFNCDGHDDLAVGLPDAAWQDSSGKINNTGVVIVYYGSPEGLFFRATNSVPAPPPSRTPGAPISSGDYKLYPPIMLVPDANYSQGMPWGQGQVAESNVRFGQALAVGNFNRDFQSASRNGAGGGTNLIGGRPCMDLAIGAPGLFVPGGPTSDSDPVLPGAGGGVYIRYGAPSGLSNGSVAAVSRPFTDFGGSCPGPATSSDQSTASLHPSSGNLGVDKIVPRYYYPAASCSGTLIYPFYEDPTYTACVNSTNSSFSLTSCARPRELNAAETDSSPDSHRHNWAAPYYRTSEFYPFINQGGSVQGEPVGQALGIGSQFGMSLSAGDLDGDGFDDLAVGAPNARSFYTPNRADQTPVARGGVEQLATGAAFVYFGGRAGLRYSFEKRKIDISSECGREIGGVTTECAANAYSTGVPATDAQTQSGVAKLPSPIKFTLGASVRQGKERLGTSLVIANTHVMRANNGDVLETATTGNEHTGQLWVGAPGAEGNKGAVYIFQPFEGQSRITVEGQAPIRSVQQKYAWAIRGDSAGDAFGSALAAGNFRDPRFGRFAPSSGGSHSPVDVNAARGSLGLDYISRNRIREAVAVGAPGYSSSSGRVFVYGFDEGDSTSWPTPAPDALTGSRVASVAAANRVQSPLCDSATSCPGSILPNPAQAGAGFGSMLSTVRQPLSMILCDAADSCDGGLLSNGSDLAGKWQPAYDAYDMDTLLVGAPLANSSRGRAFLYRSSVLQGLNPSSSFEYSAPQIISSANSQYGAAGAGGFFSYFWANPGLAVGAPYQDKFGPSVSNRSVQVSGGGSLALFQPLHNGDPTPIETAVDMAIETPDPNGASFLSVSSLPTTGFERARYVGDLNCDGYADAVLPHYRANGPMLRTELLVLYGSPTGLVTKKADGTSGIPVSRAPAARMISDSAMGMRAPQWIDTSTWSMNTPTDPTYDTDPLKYFAGVGSVDGDNCDDLIVGHKNFVVLHGSDSGLVLAAPSTSPINKNPKLLKFPTGTVAKDAGGVASTVAAAMSSVSAWTALPSASDITGSTATPPLFNTQPSAHYHQDLPIGTPNQNSIGGVTASLQPSLAFSAGDLGDWSSANADIPGALPPICHGDFNGDGYDDVAIGSVSYLSTRDLVDGSPSGPATTVDPWVVKGESGRVVANSGIFVFYGSANGLQTSVDSADYYDFSPFANLTTTAATAVAGSPFDSNCVSQGGGAAARCRPALLFDPMQFIVSTETTATALAAEQHYEPYRPWRDSQLRVALAKKNIDPTDRWTSILDRFGELCVSPGDVDGDGYDDLVVPLPRSKSRAGSFVLFRGSARGLRNGGATDAPIVSDPVRVVRTKMHTALSGELPVLTTTAQLRTDVSGSSLAGAGLGASGAGLGDLNRDFYADFALGIPNLPGAGNSNGVAKNGGVALFYGSSTFGRNTITSAGDDPLYGSIYAGSRPFLLAAQGNVLSKYELCDNPGATGSCQDPSTKVLTGGHLLRPDNFDGGNQGGQFGLYVDAAGDVNGDNFADLLVPMPNYNPAGFTGVGASFIYFGRDANTGSLDAGWEDASNVYHLTSPSENANCDKNGRCRPYLLMPEFATATGSRDNQAWRASGGMIIKANALPRNTRYRFADYGTRNLLSPDASIKSSDLLMSPVKGLQYKYKPTYDHLGGLFVWY